MFSHRVDEELALEILTLGTVDELFSLTDESRDFLSPWLPWVSLTHSAEDTRSFIMASMNQFARNDGFQAGIHIAGISPAWLDFTGWIGPIAAPASATGWAPSSKDAGS